MPELKDISLAVNQTHIGTVKTMTDFGCYVDIGYAEDVLIPSGYMQANISNKMAIVVFVFHDDDTNRVLATNQLFKFFDETNNEYFAPKQTVNCMVWSSTELGYKVLLDNEKLGLLFHSEALAKHAIGAQFAVTIKQIREDDKIDVTQHVQSASQRKDLAAQILDDLVAHDGISSLTDKSSPEDIAFKFSVSKGAYKKAIGALFKAKKITITKDFIKLID
ncbi:S1-like domain-containing RNA-binding protein [Opacimonas viscosa]|uniref:S1-like domain-containing RNA-binding protein n=1 Tax=Opacimonas viscosa TaxID=2961944 RepID=A0AA42BK80_9ALTE|nr:S1-like domain-containing RNA-binding protein [Opacimonas viscosa]MCP3427389.1 S1-like domain-containing RNA-binding protein [Opacimonas viscosa]